MANFPLTNSPKTVKCADNISVKCGFVSVTLSAGECFIYVYDTSYSTDY